MSQEIDRSLKQVEELLDEDLSQDEQFGTESGFHEVEEVKFLVASKIKELLTELSEVSDELPEGILSRELAPISKQLSTLTNIRKQVSDAAKRKTADPQFARIRTQAINSAKSLGNSFEKDLIDAEFMVRIGQALKNQRNLDLSEKLKEIEDIFTFAEKSKSEASEIVETLRDTAANESYKKTATSYTVLSDGHEIREWWWFGGVLAGMLGLIGAVLYVIFGSYGEGDSDTAIVEVFRRLVILGTPILVLRISLTKYNAERFLRIIYDHRSAAIEQLKLLEASIDDDLPLKAELRLEAARIVLSDPSTTYGSSTDGSDINISPVFSAIEKATSKQT